MEIVLKITDTDSNALTAWMQIKNSRGEIVNPQKKYYGKWGFPVEGEYEIELKKGEYEFSASKGLSYKFDRKNLRIEKDTSISFILEKWCGIRENGWFTGECHDHINYPLTPDKVVPFLAAHEVDTLSFCQGWCTDLNKSVRGHDGQKITEYLESFSTEDVHLYMGAEFPKTRFGHTCWWKFPLISDPASCYMSYHDSDYFDLAGISDKKIQKPSVDLPYESESTMFKIERWKKQGGVSAVPHPTSWWMDNEKASLICTNIAVDVCFDLLGERLFDTFVAMGYDPEQIFYQNLWFYLLNLGYVIPASAETDGDTKSHHIIGSLRTYVQTSEKTFDRENFLRGLCRGNSFLTSGPLLFAELDDGKPPGSIIKSDGEKHSINVEAYSNPDPEEYLSWIILYKNGKAVDLIDIEDKKLRKYEHVFNIKTDKNARDWYIVKVYGRKRHSDKKFVDIMEYCELCEKETNTEYTEIEQVAFTNPFYFHPENYREPAAMRPDIRGIISDKVSGKPLENIKVKINRNGKCVEETLTDAKGNYSFSEASLLSEIEINDQNYLPEIKSVHLHYPPLRDYFEYIYAGKWALENPSLQPGQVPWKVFKFDELKQILNNINFDFKLKKE